jgi:hypothetical protein
MSQPPACPRSRADDRFVRNSTILRAATNALERLTSRFQRGNANGRKGGRAAVCLLNADPTFILWDRHYSSRPEVDPQPSRREPLFMPPRIVEKQKRRPTAFREITLRSA